MVVLTKEVAEGGRVKTVCPTLKPKHIMGVSGDSMDGMPEGALGYVGEGASMFGAQVIRFDGLARLLLHSHASLAPDHPAHRSTTQRSSR